MEDLLLRQLEARKQRRPYAVATIVEATGSTPRTEGKMLVYADGSSIGTIGGGIAELQAKKDAAYVKDGVKWMLSILDDEDAVALVRILHKLSEKTANIHLS